MKWYTLALRKYAVFSGRAGRREFWYFVLFNLFFAFLWAFVAALFGGLNGWDLKSTEGLGNLYIFVTLLPAIAVSIRRLHDTGRSGWWILIEFIPLLGLILIAFFSQDSQPGTNKFGPSPKEVTGAV